MVKEGMEAADNMQTSVSGVNRCRLKRSLTIAIDRHRRCPFFLFFSGGSGVAFKLLKRGNKGKMEAQEMVVPASTSLAAQVSRNEEASREESSIIKARVRCLVRVFICVCVSVCLSGCRDAGSACLSLLYAFTHARRFRCVYLSVHLSCLSVCLDTSTWYICIICSVTSSDRPVCRYLVCRSVGVAVGLAARLPAGRDVCSRRLRWLGVGACLFMIARAVLR